MAVYNHLEAIGAIVNELFKVPGTTGMTLNKQIHASASAKMLQRIGGENYVVYTGLFTALADTDAYDVIVDKEFYSQTVSERVLMQCQRAEASLYAYYLIPKLKKLNNNDVSYDGISLGQGNLSPSDLDKLKNKRDEFLTDAYDILDTVDFSLGDYGVTQNSGAFFYVTDTNDTAYPIDDDGDE